MATVTLDSRYTDVLAALGGLELQLETAVRQYTYKKVSERIIDLQREIAAIQSKYQTPYELFYARVTTDEEFVQMLRQSHPTWERDLNAWEYYTEELSEWLGRLNSILKN